MLTSKNLAACVVAVLLLSCESDRRTDQGSTNDRSGGDGGPGAEQNSGGDDGPAGESLDADESPNSDDDATPGSGGESADKGGDDVASSVPEVTGNSVTPRVSSGGAPNDAEVPDASAAGGAGGRAGAGGTPNVSGGGGGGGGAVDEQSHAGGAGGTSGTSTVPGAGPCDIYEQAGTPCVAAYSTIRALRGDYAGPLYQVRSGSSAANRGSGGDTHDIGVTEDGFAEADALDAVCSGTTCTVSILYDQSGRGNHLQVAKPPQDNTLPIDNFETVIHRDDGADALTVSGHRVYSLYVERTQGYALAQPGDGVPFGLESQGIYMLADGTHSGTACCWEFGNGSLAGPSYASTALLLGVAYWGYGEGDGPWFMADYGAGVWAGGTNPGDPGWGAIGADPVMNSANPSMAVPFALGFLKTSQDAWQLSMANVQTATAITMAYTGGLPVEIENQGSIVLGIDSSSSNNSFGTFFEGAVVAGFPADRAELDVLDNVKAAGYETAD